MRRDQKQDISLTRAAGVKRAIHFIRDRMRALYAESCRVGLHNIPTLETLMQVYPDCAGPLTELVKLGLPWDYLVKVSDLNSVKISARELSPRKGHSPKARVENKLYQVVGKIKDLFHDMQQFGDTSPYVSRDVFCTIHPTLQPLIDFLEQRQIPWTTLIKLAGIPVESLFSADNKRLAGLSCKSFLESSGLTSKHLMLLQKLLVHLREESPETLDHFVKDTFGVTVVNDRFYAYMLSRLSDVINYLNSIS